MKKALFSALLLAGVSTAMAASVDRFADAHVQQNPYAQSNAQIAKQQIRLEQAGKDLGNGKQVQEWYRFVGESTASNVDVQSSSLRVNQHR